VDSLHNYFVIVVRAFGLYGGIAPLPPDPMDIWKSATPTVRLALLGLWTTLLDNRMDKLPLAHAVDHRDCPQATRTFPHAHRLQASNQIDITP